MFRFRFITLSSWCVRRIKRSVLRSVQANDALSNMGLCLFFCLFPSHVFVEPGKLVGSDARGGSIPFFVFITPILASSPLIGWF
ncbi:hypothetical protein EDB80DRAFT_58244 [Ilyonectria destructans]|nr:hypothetical protein EDB80DRAFT_58244 [Ilyonectria destructans]